MHSLFCTLDISATLRGLPSGYGVVYTVKCLDKAEGSMSKSIWFSFGYMVEGVKATCVVEVLF